ncbi:MAG: hypothetical protein WBO45_15080, partial [Planctomycetota bacterium]
RPLDPRGIGNVAHAVAYAANGDLILGGAFRDIDGVPTHGVGRWDGVSWHAFGSGLGHVTPGITPAARAVLALADGSIVVGGDFATADGIAANGIAMWTGTAWQPLGAGVASATGVRPTVRCLAVAPNGDVLAGGDFQTAGGVACSNLARWNGSGWSALGAGLPGFTVDAIAVLPNGNVVAGKSNPYDCYVMSWDGASWQVIGQPRNSPFSAGRVLTLLALPDGDLLACGEFTSIDWLPFGAVARWSAGSWHALGSGFPNSVVQSLVRLPNGDVIAGRGFPATLHRWNGSTWAPLVGGPLASSSLAVDARGEIAAAGSFLFAGNVISAYLARAVATCPATAAASGSGCTGSGGSNQLAVTALPWLGTTSTTTATGMPANALAVAIYGFSTQSTPLANILPQGAPGCMLLVTPDLLLLYATTAATLTTATAIPNTPTLIGQSFHHQVVPFEISALGTIATVTATNRLTLTIGAL